LLGLEDPMAVEAFKGRGQLIVGRVVLSHPEEVLHVFNENKGPATRLGKFFLPSTK